MLALHWLSWYSPFLHGGSVGVDVFFALSGYIITTILWRSPMNASLTRTWWAFVRRRMLRLYPALLGLVVVSTTLYALVPEAPTSPGEVARQGVMVLAQARPRRLRTKPGAFGCQPCSRTGRRGHWRSSGTSTSSGRWRCSPRATAAPSLKV